MSRTLTLPENTQGRDFVVGDLHGAYELLREAMEEAKFDPAIDRVISVGDLIDRGPESAAALEMLKQPWFFAVRGNHEDMFLNICRPDGTLKTSLTEVLERNGMDWIFKETAETRAKLYAAFSKLPLAIDVTTDRGTVGFVHAEVPAGMDWKTFRQKLDAGDADTVQSALWSRERIGARDGTGVTGIDRVFCGHTPQQRLARRLGNCYYIDTGAVFRLLQADRSDMFLTFADIRAETGRIQTPPYGRQRERVVVQTPPKGKPFGSFRP